MGVSQGVVPSGEPVPQSIYVTVYRKTGHNAACVNIEKRSIDFLKMSRRKGTVRSIIVGTT